jgi:hypothetical protein
MMQLQLLNFQTLVANATAAVQGSARQLIDLTVGSTLRAILEANASLALWIQWLIVQVLATTRASTSNGADLDTWVADFSFTRLPSSPAIGQALFSRFTPALPALIPAGTTIRTADGSQIFSVVADLANAAWNAAQAGYTIGAGIASITLPIAANAAGSIGNVQPASITLLASAIAGVDTVTNPLPLVGGLDSESDEALRQRFGSFLASRARATPRAIGHAILSVRQGLSYNLQENIAPDGTTRMGSFVVTADDGSGIPSSVLLNQIATAIEAMRPIGSIYTVQQSRHHCRHGSPGHCRRRERTPHRCPASMVPPHPTRLCRRPGRHQRHLGAAQWRHRGSRPPTERLGEGWNGAGELTCPAPPQTCSRA